ncbi:MAG: hypothetical protein ACYC1E_05735 [Propionibacteriaceae bacterium]
MTRTRDDVASGPGVVRWFAVLTWPARVGVVLAMVVTMSAGVLIGAPPARAPWLAPSGVHQGTVQTPVPVKPSMVQAATPSSVPSPSVRKVTTELGRAGASLSGSGRG